MWGHTRHVWRGLTECGPLERSWWRGLTECGPLEKGMANPFSILPREPNERYEKQKDRILKEELPKSVGAQYATGD